MTFEFLDLRRPQYPSSPEVLLSALAWSTVERRADTDGAGLIYERLSSTGKRKVVIHETKPKGESFQEFATGLQQAGLQYQVSESSSDVAQAFANALQAPLPLKGVGIASSAVGVAGALLQDAVGGLSAASPPNFAHLINTIYSLGGVDEGVTASARWHEAAVHFASDKRLTALESALVSSILKRYVADTSPWPPAFKLAEKAQPGSPPCWWGPATAHLSVPTPFSWFRCSWDRLCSPDWYQILPPRRWASWAICILRHALAFTFLWQANFYREIARGLLDPTEEAPSVARRAISPVRPLVPYRTGSISQMDVDSTIRKSLAIGRGCMNAIHAIAEELGSEAPSLPEILGEMRSGLNSDQQEALRLAISGSGDTGGLGNLHETVKYSLLARDGEDHADNYGLTRTVSRRFSHVSPGPEWIVVMSAMASAGPKSVVRLGDLIQSLKALGFQPRIDFLLSELERSGLCASAPDGDEGIEINLGFGGA